MKFMYQACMLALIMTAGLCASGSRCDEAYAYGKTYFSQRPQGNYQSRVMAATAEKTHKDTDACYALFSLDAGYRASYEESDLARYFFTQNGTLTFGATNARADVRSMDVGLPGGSDGFASGVSVRDFEGVATFEPRIKEMFFDADLYVGFDRFVKGLYGRIRVPFVHSNWNLCMHTQTAEPGITINVDGTTRPPVYPVGWVGNATEIPVVYDTIDDALLGDKSFGLVSELEAGKIGRSKTANAIADVYLELGYDFYHSPRGNAGATLLIVAPTGTCAKSNKFLFCPSIGAQRCPQVGGVLRGQYCLFDDNKKQISVYADARVTHLFEAKTKRLLSLRSGGTSAFNYWMLLEAFKNHPGGGYDRLNTIERAANLLNRCLKVRVAAMGEFTVMVAGTHNNWGAGAGYNLWARSRECLKLCEDGLNMNTPAGQADLYLIKGDLNFNVYSHRGYSKQDSNIAMTGTTVDTIDETALVPAAALGQGNVDVNIAAHPSTYSNMLFAYVGYTFDGKRQPYVAAGGHTEVGRGNTALNTWEFYLKGGLTF